MKEGTGASGEMLGLAHWLGESRKEFNPGSHPGFLGNFRCIPKRRIFTWILRQEQIKKRHCNCSFFSNSRSLVSSSAFPSPPGLAARDHLRQWQEWSPWQLAGDFPLQGAGNRLQRCRFYLVKMAYWINRIISRSPGRQNWQFVCLRRPHVHM